jgi:hypothetical protein
MVLHDITDDIEYIKEEIPQIKAVYGIQFFSIDKPNKMIDFYNQDKELLISITFDDIPMHSKTVLCQIARGTK